MTTGPKMAHHVVNSLQEKIQQTLENMYKLTINNYIKSWMTSKQNVWQQNEQCRTN